MNAFAIVINRCAFLCLLFLATSFGLSAQEKDPNRNSFYLTYGSTLSSSQVSFAYERSIYEKGIFQTKAKVFYGNYFGVDTEFDSDPNVGFDDQVGAYQNHAGLGVVQLLGWIELNAGIASASYSQLTWTGTQPGNYSGAVASISTFVPYGGLGLRYEKNHFLLRAGINNLELVYLGLGVSF